MGKNWAITIGVNKYDNLQPLQYAKADAESVREFLINEAGFEQVYLFTEDSPAIQGDTGPPMRSQPTYGTLKRFLRVRFDQPFLNTGDNFWFFFAGHGIQHEGRDYLMPLDVDPGDINATAIPVSFVTERLQRCGADNVILLMDACRNEGKRDGQGIGTEFQKGVVTVFSCSPREPSYEIQELEHGSFTYALLEGLQIQGVGNCATVERLDHYLRYQVPEINRQYGKPLQTPYTTIEPITKKHLILLPKQTTLLDDVRNLKLDAYQAEHQGDWFSAQQLWTRVLAVSPADHEAIKAIQRLGKGQRKIAQISRRKVIQWGGVTVGIVGASAIAKILSDSEPETEPLPTLTPTEKLTSFDFEVVTVNQNGEEIDRQTKQAKQVIEKLSDSVNLEMVEIPPGEFIMGSPNTEERLENYNGEEEPQHLVTVSSFFMGKYPITQEQWKAIVTLVPKMKHDLEPDPSKFKGYDRPVEQVSWQDAVEFCARLSQRTGKDYRLPSEAEWEYACRAETTTPFHFGQTITTDLANYNGNYTYGFGSKGKYQQGSNRVGSFKVANGFGLYDMHGNVWEWCADPWHDNYRGAPSDSRVWDENNDNRYQSYQNENLVKLLQDERRRLLRGGSWKFHPRRCRSAFRIHLNPYDDIVNDLGFRIVCVSGRTL